MNVELPALGGLNVVDEEGIKVDSSVFGWNRLIFSAGFGN